MKGRGGGQGGWLDLNLVYRVIRHEPIQTESINVPTNRAKYYTFKVATSE